MKFIFFSIYGGGLSPADGFTRSTGGGGGCTCGPGEDAARRGGGERRAACPWPAIFYEIYKHKQFIDNMFIELDSMQENNPRGYMQLIRSMRDGNFDKQTPDNTSGVSPSDRYLHFSNLLTKNVDQTRKKELDEIILQNANHYKTELDNPISANELDLALKDLKNNKASSFDKITNEILKTCGKIYKNASLHLFNLIGRVCLYPSMWKRDILHPIHKSNEKDDPNNYRGISIATCFRKLSSKL